ncbi:hypothetical protein MSIMFB_02692 [Mycobacterium simulans]|uniref:DUF2993 domain-containing protein n=1 Tax=Mycobacterium simulans TaxID=627089 RepID=A0A7Z7IL04_9MYCO|nr:hypothetical protein MSIMFB_02692 [Mycobacterium simulans]
MRNSSPVKSVRVAAATRRQPAARVRIKRILAVCIVLTLTVAFCAAEVFARDKVRAMIVDSARRTLRTTALTVGIGSSSMVINLITDHISAVSIAAKGASLCQFDGIDISAVLHDLSVIGGPTASHTDATVTMNPSAIRQALSEANGMDPAMLAVTIHDGLIRLNTGPSGKLTVELGPTLDGSDLVFTIRSMAIEGHPIDPRQVSAFGRGGSIQRRRSLVGLPLGLTVKSIKVTDSALMLYLTGGRAQLAVAPSQQCRYH